jgi:hypothetical protein
MVIVKLAVAAFVVAGIALVGVMVWTFWPRDPATEERRAQFGERRPWR